MQHNDIGRSSGIGGWDLDWRNHGKLPCDGMTLPAVADINTNQWRMGASVGVQLLQCYRLHVRFVQKGHHKSTSVTESRKERGFCGSLAIDMQCTYDTSAHCMTIRLPEDGVPKHTPFPSFADS